jgi:phytanoyl-CoA hydroxylase
MLDIDVDALKENFNCNGFIVLRDYLSLTELNELRDRALSLIKRLEQSGQTTGQYSNLLKSLHRHDPWFQSQLDNGRHVPLVQQLLGTQIVGCSVAWFDRPVGEATGVSPHVDVQRGEGNTNKGITIWLALDLVNKSNGCLHYLRGSHKEIHHNKFFITDIETDSNDAVQVEVNPGDAVIHNALTVHWSGGNKSDMPRRAISYFYRNK